MGSFRPAGRKTIEHSFKLSPLSIQAGHFSFIWFWLVKIPFVLRGQDPPLNPAAKEGPFFGILETLSHSYCSGDRQMVTDLV